MSVNTAQLLAEIPLFSTMDDEERRQLRAIMRERSFQPGQVVMAASNPEASFLIIEQGEMEVWLTNTGGKKVVLEVLGPGKVFGDLFMLAGKTRSASATTSGELVTLELGREAFFVILTLADVFQSVVVPRPTRRSLRLAPLLLNGMWPLWKWVALRFSSPKHRAAFLGTYAPLTVIILLLSWGLALIFGYGLLFLALQSELHPRLNDLGTSLYFAGTSLLTLGFGDIVATGGITRVLALCAGASGLAIVSGVISMFFSLYSSLGHREVLVTMLRNRAGPPPSGVTLLETYARLKMLAELPGFLTAWEEWSTEVMIGSLSYPVLPYFRSARPDESWVSALGALLDAAVLIISCIEDGPAGPAHLLYQSGCELVNDLKDYFQISPARTQAETPRTSFEAAYTRLKSAGFCLADPETALASFIELRSAYADALHSLMKYWVVSQIKF